MSSFNQDEYPNQFLGVDRVTDTNAGAVNLVESPLKFATAAGATGSIFNSGAGSPGLTGATNRIGGSTGDFYFRKGESGVTAIYRCLSSGPATTTGGGTGATWYEVV